MQNNNGVHGLTPFVVWDANNRHVLNSSVADEGILNFGCENVFSASDDHVLQPINNVQVPFVIKDACITRIHPTVLQCSCRFLRLIPVAQHGVWATHYDLARYTDGTVIVIIVKHPNIIDWGWPTR